MTKFCNHFRHLDAGQLPAFTGLGALCDLDFDLAAVVQIFRCHTEPPRCDLLDCTGRIVAIGAGLVARCILAAFTGIGFGPDTVHRDRQCFMRLRAERAQRDAGRYQALADIGDRFDFFCRDGVTLRIEFHQVAQADRRRLADGLGVFFVGRV